MAHIIPFNPLDRDRYNISFVLSSGKKATIDLKPLLDYFEKFVHDPDCAGEESIKIMKAIFEILSQDHAELGDAAFCSVHRILSSLRLAS